MQFSLQRDFITVEEEMFEVVKTIAEEKKPVIEKWRELLECERVFKREGMFYFCKKIEEAAVIEETLVE